MFMGEATVVAVEDPVGDDDGDEAVATDAGGELLSRLAWWAIMAWWAAAAWCTALHWLNKAGGNESGSGWGRVVLTCDVGVPPDEATAVGEVVEEFDDDDAGGEPDPPTADVVDGVASGTAVDVSPGGGGRPGEDPADAAKAAARAAPGNNCPGGGGGIPDGGWPGIPNPGWGGLPPVIIIIALAFSAAAAAAIRLLFSASESRGDLNKKDGSIPGGNMP